MELLHCRLHTKEGYLMTKDEAMCLISDLTEEELLILRDWLLCLIQNRAPSEPHQGKDP